MTSYLFAQFMSRRASDVMRVFFVREMWVGAAAEPLAPLQAAKTGIRRLHQSVTSATPLSPSSSSSRRFSWFLPALAGALAGGATAVAALHSPHAEAPSRLPLPSAQFARSAIPLSASPFNSSLDSAPAYSTHPSRPLSPLEATVSPRAGFIPRLVLTADASPTAIPFPGPDSPPLPAPSPHGSLPAPRSVVEGIKRLLPGEGEPGGKAEAQGEGGKGVKDGDGEWTKEVERGKQGGSGVGVMAGTGQGEADAREKGDADSGGVTCGRDCLSRHAIADAAARAAPAVVNLTVSVGRGMFSGQAMGSGAIIRADGLILTNAHVVAEMVDPSASSAPYWSSRATVSDAVGGGALGARGAGAKVRRATVAEMVDPSASSAPYWSSRATLQVTLQDGRTFDGHVLSFDSLSDIALVKVSAPSPLPVVKLGSSKALRPGDWVVALGSPLHLSNTVTAGIVSCVDRKGTELGLRGGRMDYIQTDAAINAGNSGGPLVNLDGEVVGINNMKALAADGVSFAIPIDSAVHILDQLSRHGRVVRPFVGIKMLELNASIAAQLRDRDPSFPPVDAGILVPQVIPGSPAARGGLQPGDVIVEFAGQPVTSSRQVLDLLGDKVGVKVPLVVKRANGKTVTLTIVTEEATPDM
ncbi:unnamed protein product [Closterium sp. Naga37s-1]|nr:unnamed protein product [Closterium sp. Naga37s-1]